MHLQSLTRLFTYTHRSQLCLAYSRMIKQILTCIKSIYKRRKLSRSKTSVILTELTWTALSQSTAQVVRFPLFRGLFCNKTLLQGLFSTATEDAL